MVANRPKYYTVELTAAGTVMMDWDPDSAGIVEMVKTCIWHGTHTYYVASSHNNGMTWYPAVKIPY